MKKKLFIVIALMAVFILLDELFHLTHGHGWWSEVPAFFAMLGFLGGILLFFLSKIVISALLHRDENYYESFRNNK